MDTQKRQNWSFIKQSFARPCVSCILGPRRVGKTTLAMRYIEQHQDSAWVVLNMDRSEQRLRIQQDGLEDIITNTVHRHIGDGEKIWVLIDEAQKCPEVFDQIKIIYDEFVGRDAIKFILTGSAHLNLHKLSAESLAGRIELNNLYEFNLKEATALSNNITLPETSFFDTLLEQDFIESINLHLHKMKVFKDISIEQLRHMLVWGGFPEIINKNKNDIILYLNNYVQTYLEQDIRDVETIGDLSLYRNLLSISAEQTGSLQNEEKICHALGCSRNTLVKYRGMMEATLMYKVLYPYMNSTLKRLVKSPKGYLLNNGLISLLTGIDSLNILEKTSLIGHRLENWFLNELQTWLTRQVRRADINFWRTSAGAEVDFVVSMPPYVFPFEITYGKNPENKKVNNLVNFLKSEPKTSWGFYIYNGEFIIDQEKLICFIPAWAVN